LTAQALPKDAALVELRADALFFETRKCLLPGTVVAFNLVMEGRALFLTGSTDQCLVVDKDRRGYRYCSRVPLSRLAEPDRQLIALFIAKGRGEPRIEPAA
jgi:hypothetical protein